MIDPLVRDIISSEINSIVRCIRFVAKYIGSEIAEQAIEAERVKKNLEEDIPRLQNNPGVQEYLRKPCEGKFTSIDFLSYLSRIENVYKSGEHAEPIIEEMNKSVSYVLGVLHGRSS